MIFFFFASVVFTLSAYTKVDGHVGVVLERSKHMKSEERVLVIIMVDGFGMDYYRSTTLPNLNRIEREGGFRSVHSLMPTVTNLNNASIITGLFPDAHGIVGNSFYDQASGQEYFMENDSLLLAPTIFQVAARSGIPSRLFSSKRKTVDLFGNGLGISLTPETADSAWIKRLGPPPPIYSSDVNRWLLDAALYTMRQEGHSALYYIHTTDYPMHTWAPDQDQSKDHLVMIDRYIGKIREIMPHAVILVTADHSVHHKSLCLDLKKALSRRGLDIVEAISPERDKYVRHHRGFGGTSYVYLRNPEDSGSVRRTLLRLPGVDEVMSRSQACSRFHLLPSRIGDLVVLGDSTTVFGDLDSAEEELPAGYRSHGSIYEDTVPMFLINAPHGLVTGDIRYNFQMTRTLMDWLVGHPGAMN